MGVCNSCDRENDVDREKAATKAVETRIKQIATNSVSAPTSNTYTSVAFSRSPYLDNHSATTLRSFQFPPTRPSESVRTSEVERFHFGPTSGTPEPGARPQSGVFKIPNQFSPASSPSATRSTRLSDSDVLNWTVADVVAWWCDKLPDEAIQFAPLVEDTELKGEDLLAMDLELLMSFQIDRPLAEHILVQIHKLLYKASLPKTGTAFSTSASQARDYTATSTTGETQIFSDPEGDDSIPSYWEAQGLPEETDDEGCANIRSPLTLLPPNSPRMNEEVESHCIALLEKQIVELQEKLQLHQKPMSPVGKRPGIKNSGKERNSPRGVAKGRRSKKNGRSSSKRPHGKFAVYKEGPTDIGRVTDWSPARYDIEDDGREFLDERLSVTNKRQKYHIYKEGPRDMGTISDWKPYRHNREDSGRHFLAPRVARSKPVNRTAGRKEGPRGEPEVYRKRSSLVQRGAERKNSEKRRSGSRKNSEKRRSSSRKNSAKQQYDAQSAIIRKASYQDAQSGSRHKSPKDFLPLSPSPVNFTSGDFRLLKMSLDCGGSELL